jgi:serine/threonine-protein kinase
MFPAELEDRYEVIRPLGEGGYGSVYLVKDRNLGRELALKVLDGIAADPEQAERFRREARVTSQLQHSHVVQVFDHGDLPGGRAFIGYEYVEGHDLAAVLERRENVPLAQLLKWGSSIASALQAAHDKGITHRDLKPANVLLRTDGEALLCDFGVARLAESRTVQTREGLILGTPSYVAPEIWYGAAPGPAADQFSLAATLYEVLYRRRPFPSDEPTEIWKALKAGWKPAPPSGLQGEHPALERTLMRALDPSPKKRYASVADFGRALQQTEGTHGFQVGEGASTSSATRVVAAPPETLTDPGGMTRKTLRPQFTRTSAWSPGSRLGLAIAGLLGLALVGWMAWPTGEEPHAPAPAPEPTEIPPWIEQLTTLRDARDRLPRVLQDPPGGRLRSHVQENLRDLVDARVELGLNRFLDAQVAWLQAVEASGTPWDDPVVREALVNEVLGPSYGITAMFVTLQHHGARVFGGTLDLEGTGLDRGDFVTNLLAQQKRMQERLGVHDEKLGAVTSDPPLSLRMSRAFLTLFSISNFRHGRKEGYDRERFTKQCMEWVDSIPTGDPRSRYGLQLISWVAIRAAYMGYGCPQRVELARFVHARALASEGEDGVPLDASLQALVRGGMILVRVITNCKEISKTEMWPLLDEVIEVLSAHAKDHPDLVGELSRELQEMFHGGRWRGIREKTPEMEARIDRLRALRAKAGG